MSYPEPSDKWADRTMIVFFALFVTYILAKLWNKYGEVIIRMFNYDL